MKKVFISYSHKDIEWVKDELLPKLDEWGITVHIDFEQFLPGYPLVAAIEDEVKNCDHVICVVTQHYHQSDWTRRELEEAIKSDPDASRKKIVPLVLEDPVPAELSAMAWCDLRVDGNKEREWIRLGAVLGAVSSSLIKNSNRHSKKYADRIKVDGKSVVVNVAGNDVAVENVIKLYLESYLDLNGENYVFTEGQEGYGPEVFDMQTGRISLKLPVSIAEELIEMTVKEGMGTKEYRAEIEDRLGSPGYPDYQWYENNTKQYIGRVQATLSLVNNKPSLQLRLQDHLEQKWHGW